MSVYGLSDGPWDKPSDIDWEAVKRKWRAGAVFGRACEIFGDDDSAYDWAQTPLRALDGETPLSVLETDPERVAELLKDIEKG